MSEQTDINADLLAALKDADAALRNHPGGDCRSEADRDSARAAIARAEKRTVARPPAEPSEPDVAPAGPPAERFCTVEGKRYRLLRGGFCGAWGGLPACAALKSRQLGLCAKLGYCGPDGNCVGGNWQEVAK